VGRTASSIPLCRVRLNQFASAGAGLRMPWASASWISRFVVSLTLPRDGVGSAAEAVVGRGRGTVGFVGTWVAEEVEALGFMGAGRSSSFGLRGVVEGGGGGRVDLVGVGGMGVERRRVRECGVAVG
jgi:hypothetical protein